MTNDALYRSHLAHLDHVLADALQRAAARGLALDGVLFHAGRHLPYHRDDQYPPFRPTPHFARYVPLAGPEHCVLARPGRIPVVVRVAPADYWYEGGSAPASYWQPAVDLREVGSFGEVAAALGPLGRVAYIGNSAEAASELGIPAELIEPTALLAPLDWHRAVKTEHEIALTQAAELRAAEGHRVGRKAFESGASELEIHWAYLQATGHLESELPFGTIVAIDEKSATLHYERKRATIGTRRHTFLLDAGATYDGYAADLTRTWLAADADPTFRALVEGVDRIERQLVGMVAPGLPYADIHIAAHRLVAALLVEAGIVRGGAEEALAARVTRTFFPHGVGHQLGLQVHDVGGRQANPDGGEIPPPDGHVLRNTRTLEPGHLVTIEPGLYFIPLLLEALRQGSHASLIDWKLVDQLVPLGGVRIEDNVVCTADGGRDLSRHLLPGPRG